MFTASKPSGLKGKALEEYINRKKEFENKWKRWGWYSIVNHIAATGVVTQEGTTPIESASDATFLEAMTWLAETIDLGRG